MAECRFRHGGGCKPTVNARPLSAELKTTGAAITGCGKPGGCRRTSPGAPAAGAIARSKPSAVAFAPRRFAPAVPSLGGGRRAAALGCGAVGFGAGTSAQAAPGLAAAVGAGTAWGSPGALQELASVLALLGKPALAAFDSPASALDGLLAQLDERLASSWVKRSFDAVCALLLMDKSLQVSARTGLARDGKRLDYQRRTTAPPLCACWLRSSSCRRCNAQTVKRALRLGPSGGLAVECGG